MLRGKGQSIRERMGGGGVDEASQEKGARDGGSVNWGRGGERCSGFPHSEAGEGLDPRGEGGVYGRSPASPNSSTSNGSNRSVGDDLDGGRAAARAMGGPGRD